MEKSVIVLLLPLLNQQAQKNIINLSLPLYAWKECLERIFLNYFGG